MKPNIFNFSTKELTQDAFICWLIMWADNSNINYDAELNKTAKYFIKELLSKQINISNIEISKVNVWRQYENIDIWAEINDDIALIIEDKTDKKQHSKQLERYKIIAEKYYKKKPRKLVFIYLKTGNENLVNNKTIINKGYSVFGRTDFLKVLNSNKQIKNDIFIDFKDRLNSIEKDTNLYLETEKIRKNWYAAQGFYLKLQSLQIERFNLKEEEYDWVKIGSWDYVPNKTGGFLGYWYYPKWTKYGEIYIQIENKIGYDFKVTLKISNWKQKTELLYELLTYFQEISKSFNLKITKPDRFKTGKASTLAIIDIKLIDNNEKFDIDNFFKDLQILEKVLDEFENKYKK